MGLGRTPKQDSAGRVSMVLYKSKLHLLLGFTPGFAAQFVCSLVFTTTPPLSPPFFFFPYPPPRPDFAPLSSKHNPAEFLLSFLFVSESRLVHARLGMEGGMKSRNVQKGRDGGQQWCGWC